MSARTEKIVISPEARVLRQMRIAKGLSMRAVGALLASSLIRFSQIEAGSPTW